MKKFNFVLLQIFLSVILGFIGYAIYQKGGDITLVSMLSPAIVMLLSTIFDLFTFKKFYWYLACYFVMVSILDGLVIYGHAIKLDYQAWIVIAITVVLTCGICYLFHWIYQNIKKPRTL